MEEREDPPKESGKEEPGAADGKRDRFVPVASWAMYDFANTIYSGIVVTFFLSLYLTEEIGLAATLFGVTTTLSLIASGLVSPLIGSIPDRTGRTKRYLLVTTVLCCLCTVALSWLGVPFLLLAVYFTANVAYQLAMVFYNALLPTVASPRRQGLVSGLGVALGYIGVVLALLVANQFIVCVEKGDPGNQLESWSISGANTENSKDGLLFGTYSREETGGGPAFVLHLFKGPERTEEQRVATARTAPGASLPRKVDVRPRFETHPISGSVTMTSFTAPLRTLEVRKTVRWVFLVAGVLFLLFTIPLAFFVPERRVARAQAFDWSVAREGLASVWKTLRTLPAKRNLFFFLLGNFLCVDVLNTAIAWFSKYFRAVFAFTFDDIITLGLGISGSAFLAGLVMGAVTDRVGSKPVLLAAAICLGLTLTVVGVTTIPWLALGTIFSVGALGLAGLWVAGRKFLIELAPPEKIGEYFGLYGITIKISVIGITVFAVLVDILPETKHLNYRVAILAQLLLIAPGILFLWLVKTPSKGEGKPSNA